MVIKYKRYITRTNYVGLFSLLINDSKKTVLVSGPNRSGSTRDKMTAAEIEKNREWAINKAKTFELLGYSVASMQSA
jgi:hypothetical protein